MSFTEMTHFLKISYKKQSRKVYLWERFCATLTTGKSAIITTCHRSFICCATLVCYSLLCHGANSNPINISAAVTLLWLISFVAFVKLSFGHNSVARGQYEHTTQSLCVGVCLCGSLCGCPYVSVPSLVTWSSLSILLDSASRTTAGHVITKMLRKCWTVFFDSLPCL